VTRPSYPIATALTVVRIGYFTFAAVDKRGAGWRILGRRAFAVAIDSGLPRCSRIIALASKHACPEDAMMTTPAYRVPK
jgi:hypothetical protein